VVTALPQVETAALAVSLEALAALLRVALAEPAARTPSPAQFRLGTPAPLLAGACQEGTLLGTSAPRIGEK